MVKTKTAASPDEKLAPPDTVKEIYNQYVYGMQVLQQPMVFFNNKTPLEYWSDGRLRFNVYIPQRKKNSKEWRTMYRSAMVRNKVLGIVAHILGMMPQPSIQAQNKDQAEDSMASQFFKDVVDWSMEHEGFDIKAFWGLVTAVAEGTIILKDDYGKFERTVKDIIDIDEETGKIKYKENKSFVDFVGAFTEIVPNDELLIADPFITDIQEQPWIIRRKRMPIDVFKRKYGKYTSSELVKPGMPQSWIYASDFFQPYTSITYLSSNMVEVIERHQKSGDHFDIVANGVLLTDEGNPNPRSDKKYPFVKSGFEPIDYSYFWYKSLTDKLSPEQDVYDAVLRMSIDTVHLNLIKPLVTNNPALVNEDILIPGNITYVGAMENHEVKPALGNVNVGMDSGTSNILTSMMQNASQSSLDPMQMGNSPTGGTPTATQAMQMAQNAKIMQGLFGWMYGYLITEWTKLRCQTILWRLSNDMDFSRITVADRILKNGKLGKRTYIMERGLSKRSDDEKLAISKQIAEIQGEKEGSEEIVALDPDVLSELDLFVRLDSQPQPKRTDALMQALAAEKWNVKSQNPSVWNLNYAAVQLSNAWGENPDEAINKEAPMGTPTQPGRPTDTPVMNQMTGGLNAALGMAPRNPAQMRV